MSTSLKEVSALTPGHQPGSQPPRLPSAHHRFSGVAETQNHPAGHPPTGALTKSTRKPHRCVGSAVNKLSHGDQRDEDNIKQPLLSAASSHHGTVHLLTYSFSQSFIHSFICSLIHAFAPQNRQILRAAVCPSHHYGAGAVRNN